MEKKNNLPQWQQHFTHLIKQPMMIERFQTQAVQYHIDGELITATISEPTPDNCYVLAPSTLITCYAKDELFKLSNPALKGLSRALIKLISMPLNIAQIDKLQVLNNQCLSTNMYSSVWEEWNLNKLREKAIAEAPQHALMLRSVNEHQHPKLHRHLTAEKWLPIVTRQVYILSPESKCGSDFAKDAKLTREKGWSYKTLNDRTEFVCAKRLYDQLYLEKYSQHNIRFSVDYMANMNQHGLMQFVGLFHRGTMCAVVGFTVQDNHMTTPIFGLDTQRPIEDNLYRRISWYTLNYAHQHKLSFNLSSGAPAYKRSRHAQPCLEHSFVYIKHLRVHQRLIWKALSLLTRRFYSPILIKNAL